MEFKKENYREFEISRMLYAKGGETAPYVEAANLTPKAAQDVIEKGNVTPETKETAKSDAETQAERVRKEGEEQAPIEEFLTDAAKPENPETGKTEAKGATPEKKEKSDKPKSLEEMSPGELIGTIIALFKKLSSPEIKEALASGDYSVLTEAFEDVTAKPPRNPIQRMEEEKKQYAEKLTKVDDVSQLISLYNNPKGSGSEMFGKKAPYLFQLKDVVKARLGKELGLNIVGMEKEGNRENAVVIRTAGGAHDYYEFIIDGDRNTVEKYGLDIVAGQEKKAESTEHSFDGTLSSLKALGKTTETTTEQAPPASETNEEQAIAQAEAEQPPAEEAESANKVSEPPESNITSDPRNTKKKGGTA